MLNTFGLHSVNKNTFNQQYHDPLQYPKEVRNLIVTALRVHNGVLNVLGYIPGVSFFSGIARIITGAIILTVTLGIGERSALQGAIIGRWYDEALLTGVAQIGRGILEAFIPYGWIINAAFDVTGTIYNVGLEFEGSMICEGCMGLDDAHVRPHADVDYPLPFWALYLA